MNYRDLGFDDSFADDSNKRPEFISGVQYELEGVAGGNILREGVSHPFGGNWQIKYDGDGIELPPGGLKNFQAQYDIRAFKAIVNPNGSGDFVDIQQAVDFVEENGGGTVYLSAGTYRPTRYIDVPSNTFLLGDNRYTTIIDFANATSVPDGCIQIKGTSVSSAGTMTATNGSDGITGSSTTFVTDNVKPGDIITINDAPYVIESIESNTALTLEEIYRGETISEGARINRPKENIEISNLTVRNGFDASPFDGNGIELLNANSVYIHDCVFENNVSGVNLAGGFDIIVENCIGRFNSSYGFIVSAGGTLINNTAYNNLSHGIYVSSASADYTIVSSNKVLNNGNTGIALIASSNTLIAENHVANNLEYGIYLDGATNNLVTGNFVYNNGNDGVRLEDRFSLDSQDNLISDNYIMNNDGHAIELTSGTQDNFVHGCIIRGNTTNSVLNNGTANTVSDVS